MSAPLESLHETVLQRAVYVLLSNPSTAYHTVSGSRLQVLAPGRINVHEGPDFMETAILLDGTVMVGNVEFHKKSSDWRKHNHSNDPRYSTVILHIVLDNDEEIPGHTLPIVVLPSADVQSALLRQPAEFADTGVEDVHTYSLLRLLRLTAEHKEFLRNRTPEQAFVESVKLFLQRFEKKRRRPAYPAERLVELMNAVPNSPHARFIKEALATTQTYTSLISQSVHASLNGLLSTPITDEGEHLRREIMVNSIIPCSLALASDAVRISIFEWYWSVEALLEYGVLQRSFPHLPQVYLWQQQGMLEMMREKNADTSAHEAMRSYGLMHTLHFYKLALESPELEDER